MHSFYCFSTLPRARLPMQRLFIKLTRMHSVGVRRLWRRFHSSDRLFKSINEFQFVGTPTYEKKKMIIQTSFLYIFVIYIFSRSHSDFAFADVMDFQ